jgi:Fic family protein
MDTFMSAFNKQSGKTYEKSHPWLTFQFDLSKARPRLWILLGEAQSKSEHIAGVPLRPSTAKELHMLYLSKGVAATTAIEGNTLSEEEVLNRIKGKRDLPDSLEYLGQEIDNVVAACNRIADQQIAEGTDNLTGALIIDLNRMVLEKLKVKEGVVPGKIRTYSVGVAGYRGAPAEDCAFLLQHLCDWLNSATFRPPVPGENPIIYGLVKAIVAHVYLAWIHPFGDGNGRTARLVEFLILISAGVPLPAAHLLSNHYNQTRQEYYRQLEKTSLSGGDLLPFIEYAVQGFVDGTRQQLAVIRDQQMDVAWRNFVHDLFKEHNRPADIRARHLILDLSEQEAPVRLSKLSMISPRLAAAYSGKTIKAVRRDVRKLLDMGLIEITANGVRPKKEIISAFLPRCRVDREE